jgi:hypothetical protein
LKQYFRFIDAYALSPYLVIYLSHGANMHSSTNSSLVLKTSARRQSIIATSGSIRLLPVDKGVESQRSQKNFARIGIVRPRGGLKWL